MYTLIVVYNYSLGAKKKRLVEIALEGLALENKLKDKKLIAVCYNEVFINSVSPKMYSGFSEDHPFVLEVDQPW